MTFNERKTLRGRIRYKAYRFRWWLAQYWTPRAPIHLDIEINSTCNLRCPICHQSDEPRVYDLKHMKRADVLVRLTEAKRIGVLSIKLNWRGESLVHPDFWDILQYALDLDFVDILINTNLSVEMTEPQIKLLAQVPSIKVSIDSVINYAKARRGGDLRLVMYNIVRLFRYRDSLETNRHESALTEPFDQYRRAFQSALESVDGIDKVQMMSPIKMHNGKAQVRNSKLGVFMPEGGRHRVYCGMPSRRLLLSATSGRAYPCCVPYAERADMVVGENTATLLKSWQGAGRFRKGLKKNPIGWTDTCKNCASSDAWR